MVRVVHFPLLNYIFAFRPHPVPLTGIEPDSATFGGSLCSLLAAKPIPGIRTRPTPPIPRVMTPVQSRLKVCVLTHHLYRQVPPTGFEPALSVMHLWFRRPGHYEGSSSGEIRASEIPTAVHPILEDQGAVVKVGEITLVCDPDPARQLVKRVGIVYFVIYFDRSDMVV